MPSIPQVAEAMRYVLSEVANEAARATGFIQRQRAFDGAQFVQTLVFGWLAQPRATYEELLDLAEDLGVRISVQGFAARFTDTAVACLERVLQAAIAQVVAADPLAIPLLARFPAVLLHDSTTISLPDALAAQFRGCGGSKGQVAAALKAHLRLELRTGQVEGPLFQDGRAHDRAVAFRQRPAPGALQVRDLGFFQLDDLAADTRDGRLWLSRLKPKTAVWHDGARLELPQFLAAQTSTQVELAVAIGASQRIPCRLLAIRVPQEVADQRRRRLRKEARDKGQRVGAERLALCEWTIVVTNVPAGQLTLTEALVLLKLRWQIELLIKLWKSQGEVDRSGGVRPARVLAEVYAKFLAMLLQHWLLLSGCWDAPDRSLPKAAKVVRQMARDVARALAQPPSLLICLAAVVAKLRRAGRQTPRQKEPNAYQLLLDPSRLVLN